MSIETDTRNLAKWLNEEQLAPIDRQALARVLAHLQNQEQQAPVGRLESDPDEGHVFVPRIDGDWSMLGKDLYASPPAQQEPNEDGSPCHEFWDWLPKAYNFDGNGTFTKYNMEVAFLAGKQASQRQPNIENTKFVVRYFIENAICDIRGLNVVKYINDSQGRLKDCAISALYHALEHLKCLGKADLQPKQEDWGCGPHEYHSLPAFNHAEEANKALRDAQNYSYEIAKEYNRKENT